MRFLIRLAGILIVALMILGAGAYWYLSPTRLKTWMEPQLASALHRGVVLDGVRLDLFGPGVEFRGLTVRDRAGFGDAPFLKAETARVTVWPWRAFFEDGSLGELRLDDATISVVVNAQGQINAADLLGTRGLRLPIDQVRLVNGAVHYANWQTHRDATVTLRHGNARAALVGTAVELSGNLGIADLSADNTGQLGAVDVAYRVRLDGGTIAVPELTVGLGPLVATFVGHLRQAPSGQMFELRAEKQAVDFDRLRAFLVQRNVLSDDAAVTGVGELDVRVTGAWPPEMNGTVTISNLAVVDANRLGISEGEVSLALEGDRIRVHTLQARVGESKVSFSGVWNDWWRTRSQLSLDVTGQLFGGALNGQASLRFHDVGGDVDASMSLVNARGESLLAGLGWRVPLYGAANMTARLKGVVDTALVWQGAATQGDGVLRLAEGRIVKWDLLQAQLQGVEQLGLLTTDEVPLSDVMVSFQVTGSRIALDGTRLTAAELPCRIGGWGEWHGKLNYVLDVDVPASRVSLGGFDLGRALGALLGGDPTIPVRVTIGGTTAKPEVSTSIR